MNEINHPQDRRAFASWLRPSLFGMVHLAALPGSPGYSGDPDLPLDRALADARALAEAGFSGIMVENYGDLPFHGGDLPPITVAAMARIVGRLRQEWPELRLGVNCLRNDARSALSIACATKADAIRVNVHTGAMLSDQGVLTGQAARTLRLRRELATPVWILADLRVKHAAPLAARPLKEEGLDLRIRGLADAVILTGSGTGRPADLSQARELREVLPEAPLLVGSGVNLENAAHWAAVVDGAIVGSELMHGGKAGAGIDPRRATAMLNVWTGARASSTEGS